MNTFLTDLSGDAVMIHFKNSCLPHTPESSSLFSTLILLPASHLVLAFVSVEGFEGSGLENCSRLEFLTDGRCSDRCIFLKETLGVSL